MTDAATAVFEASRPHLFGVAYRMLGSVAEAEDVVQDAYLRWCRAERDSVDEPRAYLTRTVIRLCLDRRSSAAARREAYPGIWLPEPVVDDEPGALASELSMALMLALERLSPLERAAFLLHDVFDMDFEAVAAALERSEPAVRQLAARARSHVRDARPRFAPSAEEAARIAAAFAHAAASGDTGSLSALLAADAVYYSDGGGKRRAAINPIYGRDKIMRFIASARTKDAALMNPAAIKRAWINGLPGFVVRTSEGVETIAVEIVDGAIVAIYSVRNPDKLRHLS